MGHSLNKNDNLNKDVKTGMLWSIVERGGVQFFNLVATVVLARLLSPKDFGILGLAVLFTGASGTVTSLSFGMAIVQRDEVRKDHLATILVIQGSINALTFLVLFLIAPWVGSYFGNPLVGTVLRMTSFNFLIRIIGICPSAMLRRERVFKPLSINQMLDAFVDMIVAIPLGALGFGVWSLVYGGLAGSLVSKLYLVYASGWKPSLRMSRRAFRELFGFGMGVSIAGIINDISKRSNSFIVGKWLGTSALGYFDKATALVSVPINDLGTRANAVLFPVFARIRHEPGRFKAAIRRSVLSLSLVSYPIFCSLTVLAPEIIYVMYGSKWAKVVPPFRILAMAGVPLLLLQLMISVTFVTGKSRQEMGRRAVMTVLLVTGSIIGSRWDLAGIAWAAVIVNVFGLMLVVWQVYRLGLLRPLADVVKPQAIPFGGAMALVVTEHACQAWAQSIGLSAFISLPICLAVGGTAYLIMVAMLKDEVLTRLIDEFKGDLEPIAGRVPMFGALVRLWR
jgi:O-antigen/teichoic acid export membrane protein